MVERKDSLFCADLLISFLSNQTRNPSTGAQGVGFCSLWFSKPEGEGKDEVLRFLWRISP